MSTTPAQVNPDDRARGDCHCALLAAFLAALLAAFGGNLTAATHYFVAAWSESNGVEADTVTANESG